MVKVASFNVENLFARPKVFNTDDWDSSKPYLDAYYKVNNVLSKAKYTDADKQKISDLLVELDIFYVNSHGATRRRYTQAPKWAWLRKNRGKFHRQPRDTTQNIEIVASGRDEWIGRVELAKGTTNEVGTRMTAKVIQDVDADILGIVEADDRPSLMRFNKDLLQKQYSHIMLIDGNDERGSDVGIMMGDNFEIQSMRSNVDTEDAVGTVFSRDCPQYEVRTPNGTVVHVLVNHFKSQSGGGGKRRKRQAVEVRRIVDDLVAQNQHVIVLGDFNEGISSDGSYSENFKALFKNNSPLVDCFNHQLFDDGGRPGTYDSCGWSNRLDYILISKGLEDKLKGGGVFRNGLWGTRKTRPTKWTTYPEITESSEQASDHAAVFVELDI